jgi:ectoine hydroxylase-related dioxygenase (phytanoyl-CoA dioxygenase family)
MASTESRVTEEQIEQFHEEGYLIIEDAFNPDEVSRMREKADHILELIVNSSLANDRKSGRLDLVQDSDGEQQVRKVQPVNDHSLFLSKIAEDDRLLDPMRAIMDDEPILMEEKLNYKQPLPNPIQEFEPDRDTSGFPVHNDWAYYKDNGYPRGILSSGIALDECTSENGAMKVWPGSHTEHVEHRLGENGYEVPPEDVNEEEAVEVLVPAGSVMFFHSLLVHSSTPNETNDPRRLMIYSHYPEEADMGVDVRNGPARLRESPWEWEYQRKKDRGEFEDRFEAP